MLPRCLGANDVARRGVSRRLFCSAKIRTARARDSFNLAIFNKIPAANSPAPPRPVRPRRRELKGFIHLRRNQSIFMTETKFSFPNLPTYSQSGNVISPRRLTRCVFCSEHTTRNRTHSGVEGPKPVDAFVRPQDGYESRQETSQSRANANLQLI